MKAILLLLLAIFTLAIITSPLALAANYNLVKKWGSLGNTPSQFNEPSDITLDPFGNATYVSDLQNNRIQKFDSNGNYIKSWGSAGIGPGQGQDEVDLNHVIFPADLSLILVDFSLSTFRKRVRLNGTAKDAIDLSSVCFRAVDLTNIEFSNVKWIKTHNSILTTIYDY